MAKRKSPKEIIESTKEPHNEHAYIKYPRENLKDVTLISSRRWTIPNYLKRHISWKKHKEKPFSIMHTHPRSFDGYYGALPSATDLGSFLFWEGKAKTSIISQQDPNTTELLGYTILKKTKKTPKLTFYESNKLSSSKKLEDSYGHSRKEEIRNWADLKDDLKKYDDLIESGSDKTKPLLDFSRKYNLLVKFVPAKGYKLDGERGSFAPQSSKFHGHRDEKANLYSQSPTLEKKVGSIIGISLLGSIIFSSANITGHSIANLAPKTTNVIGVLLFIFGMVVSCFYLRRRQ